MFEVLPANGERDSPCSDIKTHARTLEKSAEGDITKLSLLLDQDIRFCMLESSNILQPVSLPIEMVLRADILI